MDRTKTFTPGIGSAFGMGSAAHLPMSVHGAASGLSRAQETGEKRSVLSRLLGIVKNAAIAVAFMALLPIGMVAVGGPRIWRSFDYDRSVFARVRANEVVRPFMLRRDVSITPVMAGVALHTLERPRKSGSAFAVRQASVRDRPWETQAITPEMFRTARPDVFEGPSPLRILDAGAKGFSADEKAYLQRLATAPIWRDFNLVARAQAIDVVGTRTPTPFPVDATWAEYPTILWSGPRELAYAAVSRAAWFESIGQRDSAEATLRAIVSVGFAAIDNGVTTTDELVGNAIVGLGREALGHFYKLTNDSRAGSAAFQGTRAAGPARPVGRSPDEIRRSWIARANNATLPRAERIEGIRMLSLASCTNVRELMLGPRADVTDAIARAEQSLTRYPADGEFLKLSAQFPQFRNSYLMGSPITAVVASSASVVATVIGNPRLVTCSVIAASQRPGP
jgi:hypothetical protein